MITVLIIDDEPETEMTIGQWSGNPEVSENHRFYYAATDADALKTIGELERIDIVFINIDSDVLSGLELFFRVERKETRFPRVALTRGDDLNRLRIAVSAGAVEFMLKPVVQNDMMEAIGRVYAQVERRRKSWKERAEYVALRREISVAAEMQNRFLPKTFPLFKNVNVFARTMAAKDVGVLGDLLELKLTPDSYDYYRTHKSEFKPDQWADALRALGAAQKPPQAFAFAPGPLSAAIPAMSSFYEVARERDQAMIDNAMKQVKEFNVPFAVLIAGGFHTPAFERIFRDRKVSYAVVAPKVGKVTAADTEKYHRVLKETYVPMSDKYREKLGFPAAGAGASPRTTSKNEETSSARAGEVRPVAYDEADQQGEFLLAAERR